MEDKLLGHLLQANDSAATREVEQWLAADPAGVQQLALLENALAPLATDRTEYEPPDDLWVRTLSRVAQHIVATEAPAAPDDPARSTELPRRAAALTGPVVPVTSLRPASEALPTTPRRRNVTALVGLSAAVLALVFPAVVHVRANSQRAGCQDSMRELYHGVSAYSDTHDGRFPKVEDGRTAAMAAEMLKLNGYLPRDTRIDCPGGHKVTGPISLVNYAYNLGYRDDAGVLHGIERKPGNDGLVILADAPRRDGAAAFPFNHRHGQNVLYANGNVRFCTTPHVGVNGDDIFCNARGHIGAGVFQQDTALGRTEERP